MNKPAPKPYKDKSDAVSRCAKSIYGVTHRRSKPTPAVDSSAA